VFVTTSVLPALPTSRNLRLGWVKHVSIWRDPCGLKHSRSLTQPPAHSHNSSLPQSLTDTLTYCFTHTFDSSFTHSMFPLHTVTCSIIIYPNQSLAHSLAGSYKYTDTSTQ